jgi:hypothetical protein
MGIGFWIGSAIVLLLVTCYIVLAPFLGLYGDVKGKDKENGKEKS